ncbi:Ulp1 protease family protein [Talaromyces stipitatus ATCC 10500]|uniref:Ulp1 protease family protein n=1 Tax=Talaromyces stipitatus (strain ATCC 10500 / CBS 375.48 / QM 6759 / NRRL 1006) TaxID=441959 RepID=B8MDF4_TALSN|nr:Ulp1 protease family protein [Talaromyces stipitatus ATCC 10500]EED17917.1 Ulp1 protease family protein [Talaromyces stipitatus ATCC 10500]
MRRREESASAEQRLFPTYNKSPDDVPIRPGQTFGGSNNKSQIRKFNFHPRDFINSRRRDSGPVRAWGGRNTANGSAQYSTPSRHPLSSPTLVDNDDRVLKRRRHSSGPVIDLVVDDDTQSVHEGDTRRDQSVEPTGDYETKGNPTQVFQVPEDDDPEDASVEVKSTKEENRSGESIEIDDIAPLQVEKVNSTTHVVKDAADSEEHHLSDRSESPDELQKDVTFRTYPRKPASNLRAINFESISDEDIQKQSRGLKRRISPNDIRPTLFNSSNKTPERRYPRSQRFVASHRHLFEVSFFRYGNVKVENRSVQLFLDEGKGTIGLLTSSKLQPSVSVPIRRIMQVLVGSHSSLKTRFSLSKIEGSVNQDLVDVEFASEQEKDQLCSLLQKKNVKLREKLGNWMDKAFNNVTTIDLIHQKRPSSPGSPEPADSTKPDLVKRQRLSATMQGEEESLKGIKQPPRRMALPVTQSSGPVKNTRSTHDDEGIAIPVKTYQAFLKERETRCKDRQGLVDLVENEPNSIPETASPGDGTWSKPLVYPRVGKKKAEVNSYDLERLRDGEFLNDNLIGLYARFLEHYLERNKPEVSKRVYFFNSYFYATLTTPVKGRKGINYPGVAKWTRNVDLFDHDYVIIPINESAHWYLAIICNLTSLKRRYKAEEVEVASEQESPEQQETIDQKEIPETPPSAKAATPEETTRVSHAWMKVNDVVPNSNPQSGADSADEWPEKEENRTSPPGAFHNGNSFEPNQSIAADTDFVKRKKPKFAGPIYSLDQPTIITFDSLNEPRQHAIKVLKQYLVGESIKAKIQFSMKDVKGMTAKGIPLQPNFSDCGLYLLAYLEKFVQEPDTFIRNLLRREMDTHIDWPTLKSGLLRRRLREFLFKLHDEQESGRDTGLLVDAQPISYLLGPSTANPTENAQDAEAAPVAEPEIIADSFQEKDKEDEADSDEQSIVQETQISEQQSAPDPPPERETINGSKAAQHVSEVVEIPKTPERELPNRESNANVEILDSSPVDMKDAADKSGKESPGPGKRVEADKDVFEDMFEYLSQDTPPRNIVEVRVPIVQVPGTPPSSKKPGRDRTSPRQVKSKRRTS